MVIRCLAVLGVMLSLTLLMGCKPAEQGMEGTGTIMAAEIKEHKIMPAEIGKDFICPVLGTRTKVKESTPALEYKGQVYYFCCPGCPGKFKADPEKYIKMPEMPGETM